MNVALHSHFLSPDSYVRFYYLDLLQFKFSHLSSLQNEGGPSNNLSECLVVRI